MVTVSSGQRYTVSSGQSDTGDVVVYGGILLDGSEIGVYPQVSGGVIIGTTVSSGGRVEINLGGVASGTTIDGGGIEQILRGGIASGTIVSGGGALSR